MLKIQKHFWNPMSFSLETVNVQSMQLQTLLTPQTYVQTKRLQDLGS